MGIAVVAPVMVLMLIVLVVVVTAYHLKFAA